MTGSAARHTPVLLKEVVQYLLGGGVPSEKTVIVDATFGSGGHSRALFDCGAAQIYGIDRDPVTLKYASDLQAHLKSHQKLDVIQGSFSKMTTLLESKGVQALETVPLKVMPLSRTNVTSTSVLTFTCRPGSVHGVLLDLGTSSMQLEDGERGFSFAKCGPLDMRMDPNQKLTARNLVNELPEEELSSCLLKYGEERLHGVIARAIVNKRKNSNIETTDQLARIVSDAVGWRRRSRLKDGLGRGLHPATRTFQALRIVVNNELEELVHGLMAASNLLAPNGRLVVISFHSLEDRIVKRFLLGEHSSSSLLDHPTGGSGYRVTRRKFLELNIPSIAHGNLVWRWKPLHSKVIRASQLEILSNPRVRSAKLRAAEKI